MQHGFIKVAAITPQIRVADPYYNAEKICEKIAEAEEHGAKIMVFPELCLTGYTCQDLFLQQMLLESAETAMMMLLDFTRQLDIISIVGLPVVVGDLLLNCAAIIQHGKILGLVPKTYLPNYREFYEKRWFASSEKVAYPVRQQGFEVEVREVIRDHLPDALQTFLNSLVPVEAGLCPFVRKQVECRLKQVVKPAQQTADVSLEEGLRN